MSEEIARIEATLPHLATKADVSDLRTEVRTEIASVRTEISNLELRLIKWAIGVGVTATVAISLQIWGAVEFLLTRHT